MILFSKTWKTHVSHGTDTDVWFKVVSGLFLVFIFFPVKKIFLTEFSYATGEYSDFSTLTIYAFDLIAIASVICFAWSRKHLPISKTEAMVISSLLILPLLHQPSYRVLEYYYAARFALYICLSGLLFLKIHEKQSRFVYLCKLMLFFSAIQTVIGLFQLYFQSSVGLKLIGEGILSPVNYGIAKVVSYGTGIFRPYGTLPHPNILSGLLGISIFLSLIPKRTLHVNRIHTITLQIITIFGIGLCVSRGTILGTLLALGVLLISFTWNKSKEHLVQVWLCTTALFVILSITGSLYLSKSNSQDSSVQERLNQNIYAYRVARDKTYTGIGQGTSMFHMEQYLKKDIPTWEKQPIHNFFLLNISEFGILISTLLIYVLFIDRVNIFAYLKRKTKKNVLFSVLPIFILTTMLFDHYYATSPIMIAVLWLSLRASQAYLSTPYDNPVLSK